ncbi:hypothetical protein CAPTEDRAFT_92817, partial [Capitella teleta]
VSFSYLRFRVKVYTPTPIRCFKCQHFGHVAAKCSKSVRCSRCGEAHATADCRADAGPKC